MCVDYIQCNLVLIIATYKIDEKTCVYINLVRILIKYDERRLIEII